MKNGKKKKNGKIKKCKMEKCNKIANIIIIIIRIIIQNSSFAAPEAQDLSESDWRLQSLVVLLSDAFAQSFDESDCKFQNLVRFDLSSLLLRVCPDSQDRVLVKRVPDAKCHVRHIEVMLQCH